MDSADAPTMLVSQGRCAPPALSAGRGLTETGIQAYVHVMNVSYTVPDSLYMCIQIL